MERKYKNVIIGLLVGLNFGLSSSFLHAQTWDVDADGDWSRKQNWSPQSVPNATGATATLGNIITANRTITVDKNETIGVLNINDNNNYTLSRTGGGTRRLTFDATGSGPAQINVQNSGSPTISGSGLAVRLGDDLRIDHTGTGIFTISTVIEESGGSKSITHTGTGTTIFSGANTYSGATTISGGVLEAQSNAALGSTAAGTVVTAGGALGLRGGVTITGESLQIAGDGGGGGALRNLGSNNTFAGNITLSANAEIENAVAGTTLTIGNGSFTNFINTTGSGHTITFDGPGNIFLNSGITGSGSLSSTGPGNVVKNGTGTLQYYADENWYTGSTTINDGTLRLDTITGINGAIKGTDVILGDSKGSAGSAILRNGDPSAPAANEMINDTATITFRSDGLYDLNTQTETIGALNFTGGEVRTGVGGSLRINAASAAAAITSNASASTALINAAGGDFRLNGSRTFTVADGAAATDLEVRGNVANGSTTSGVTKTGAGKMSFTGVAANTYTGATTVSGGILELAKSSGVNAIAGSAITVNSGGTLLLGNSNQIINSANLTLAGGTFSTGATVGYSETLGTLTLSGASTINLGTASHLLQFANSSALSGSWSGALTIYGWLGLPAMSGTAGQIFFGSNASALTAGQLAMISFNGFGNGAILLTSGELVPVPVPEAKAILAAFFVLGMVAYRERRLLTVLLLRRVA